MKRGQNWEGKAEKSWIFLGINILPVDVDCSEKLLEDFVIVQSSHETLQGLTSLILTLSFFRTFSHLHIFLRNHFLLERKKYRFILRIKNQDYFCCLFLASFNAFSSSLLALILGLLSALDKSLLAITVEVSGLVFLTLGSILILLALAFEASQAK